MKFEKIQKEAAKYSKNYKLDILSQPKILFLSINCEF